MIETYAASTKLEPRPTDPQEGSPGSKETKVAIEATDISRRFGQKWALAHIDLTVKVQEALLLAGPNGSGKTTLLRMFAGLLAPTRGRLVLHGLELPDDRRAWRRRVSLVSHDPYLYARLTAFETVRLWARLLGLSASKAELMAALHQVGLAEAADSEVRSFSAGMRKRLTLARIRLEAPSVILLDEPFAALDADGRRVTETWIVEQLQMGTTVVIASHSLERAAPLCTRAIYLEGGQISWRGSAAELPAMVENRA